VSDPRFIKTGDINFALAHAAEEAGELVAAIDKTLRWGPASVNPLLPPAEQETNAQWARRKIIDLRGALDRLATEMAREYD